VVKNGSVQWLSNSEMAMTNENGCAELVSNFSEMFCNRRDINKRGSRRLMAGVHLKAQSSWDKLI